MKYLAKLLTYLLVLNFALQPQYVQAQATVAPKAKVNFSMVKQLAHELKTNSKEYFSPEELSLKDSSQEKLITNQVVSDIRKKLLDESYSFTEIKNQIQNQLMQEEQHKLIELKVLLSKMDREKLDHFFKTALEDGTYPQDLKVMYESAYNQVEKLEVIMQMVHADMSLIRTANAKRLGLMSRADLVKQLDETGSFMSTKNDKVLTVLIIVLTVAAAGFITWGIISATKARHERKLKEMNDDYDQREQDAYNNHANRVKTLEELFRERERLREEGYVWQVCSTQKTVKTAACSYDYKTYSGQETCVTHCLKRNDTGAEAQHQKTCLSEFIPNNCFQKNPTAAGYDDGYSHGYSNGYNTGYDRAFDSAYRSAYNNAYGPAYNRGYDSGYSSGFSSGYSAGSSKSLKLRLVQEEDEFELGFQKGYQEGYSYALNLRVGGNF